MLQFNVNSIYQFPLHLFSSSFVILSCFCLKHPDVISVFQSNERKLRTTRSWGFLGLETKSGEVPRSSVWNKSRFGEDVIIANLDSGVWPQRASFRDEGYGPVPLRWKGRCEEDKTDNPIQCNKYSHIHLLQIYPNLQLEKVRAPIMADFSSRGPNMVQPAILKPDITAPGVDILAAYSAYPRAISGGEVFRIRNGTSVSCSHVTGIVGLIRALYPDWSPAAIKSAIMTSATKKDNTNAFIQNESQRNATPFDYGAGHVHPSRAADPGLVYDLTANDYLNFLCAHGYNQSIIRRFSDRPFTCPTKPISVANLNYPSLTIPDLQGRITVSRTVKNVGTPGKYSVIIKEPTGVSVYVNPRTLHFKETGEEKTFNVTLEVKADNNSSDYAFGYFTWLDGKHYVRSIIVVKLKLHCPPIPHEHFYKHLVGSPLKAETTQQRRTKNQNPRQWTGTPKQKEIENLHLLSTVCSGRKDKLDLALQTNPIVEEYVKDLPYLSKQLFVIKNNKSRTLLESGISLDDRLYTNDNWF
ncbi:subtilisin-like protease SBT5.3 [Tripterygium wilfordii]|uniref:subtilisin-like protease SBT5.3 n=1 Tax=Tripterygium wilfordii TaxID=458696 RepID=UPI0018F84D2A|nr:subtilisin-like protease SBT5.3 [Tripterygium wilfordii]